MSEHGGHKKSSSGRIQELEQHNQHMEEQESFINSHDKQLVMSKEKTSIKEARPEDEVSDSNADQRFSVASLITAMQPDPITTDDN